MPQQLMMNNENPRVWFLFTVCHIIRAVDYVGLTYPQRRGDCCGGATSRLEMYLLQEVRDSGYPRGVLGHPGNPLWRAVQPPNITAAFALGLGLVLGAACQFRQL